MIIKPAQLFPSPDFFIGDSKYLISPGVVPFSQGPLAEVTCTNGEKSFLYPPQ